MKRINYKILMSAILMLALYIILGCGRAEAASASVSASSKNVSVGDKVTINVSINAATWNVYVKGAVSDSIVGYDQDLNNKTTNKSYSLSTAKAGTYTVSISGSVKDSSGKKEVNDSVTVTVKEKASSRDNTSTNNNNNNNTNTQNKTTEEPTFKSVNETVYASKDSINIRKSYSSDSEKLGTIKLGETLTRTGIGSNGWSKVKYNGSVGYVSTALITTEQPKKSEDKALKSLSIEGVELAPAFDPEITDYGATIGKDVKKLDVKAEANSDKSKVDITGNETLQDGDNVIKITVTAEDGTTRIYTINASKKSDATITLSGLKVNGYTLSPKFSPDVTEYRITVLDAGVTNLDVVAAASQNDAKVELTGNNNLKEGENIITVTVTSADGTVTNTYKIIVTKNTTAAGATDSKRNLILYGGIGIIAFLILAIILVIIASKRKAAKEEDDDYEDDNNYEDLYGSIKQNKYEDTPTEEQNETDSVYGDFSAKANRELEEAEKEVEPPKYEDGFTENAYNSMNVYGDHKSEPDTLDELFGPVNEPIKDEPAEEAKDEEDVVIKSDYTGPKDVDYYSDKISELFDSADDTAMETTSKEPTGYMSANDSINEENKDYMSSQNDWNDDNYRPRKSKGKHAK